MYSSIFRLLVILLFSDVALADETDRDLKWVDKEIAAIKPARKGMSNAQMVNLDNPFATQLLLKQPPGSNQPQRTRILSHVTDTGKQDFNLQAIFNNNKALVDGLWLRRGSSIEGYTVRTIGKDYVVLTRKGKRLTLTLNPMNENIKIKVR